MSKGYFPSKAVFIKPQASINPIPSVSSVAVLTNYSVMRSIDRCSYSAGYIHPVMSFHPKGCFVEVSPFLICHSLEGVTPVEDQDVAELLGDNNPVLSYSFNWW